MARGQGLENNWGGGACHYLLLTLALFLFLGPADTWTIREPVLRGHFLTHAAQLTRLVTQLSSVYAAISAGAFSFLITRTRPHEGLWEARPCAGFHGVGVCGEKASSPMCYPARPEVILSPTYLYSSLKSLRSLENVMISVFC